MQRRSSIIRILFVLTAIVIAAYFLYRGFAQNNNGQLSASGTIEAVEVNVSPEQAGKVKEVSVEEGQTVKTGDPLLNLDDSLLADQRKVAAAQVDTASAALAAAQHNHDMALQNALIAEQSTTANNWRFSAPDQFNQPAWYFNQTEQLTSAQAEVDNARKELEDAQANLQKVATDLNNADFITAEKRLADARSAFLVADDVKKQAENAAQNGGLLNAAYDDYNAALDELHAAQNQYNSLLNSKAARNVLDARGKVAVAAQHYDAAYARLLGWQTGTQSAAVITASNALDQAKAAVAQAEANLSLLDTQISKLTIYAPMDGVILARNVEPGEFVQPGAAAFSMANLSELTITVYVAEDNYGKIFVGQKASVTVDSFPGQTFDAQVTYISDQAEFTPRNVQTVQGRSSTVYAIKLKVIDPQGQLKLGMPADVVFVSK